MRGVKKIVTQTVSLRRRKATVPSLTESRHFADTQANSVRYMTVSLGRRWGLRYLRAWCEIIPCKREESGMAPEGTEPAKVHNRTRIETDSMGEIEVPADRYWG